MVIWDLYSLSKLKQLFASKLQLRAHYSAACLHSSKTEIEELGTIEYHLAKMYWL